MVSVCLPSDALLQHLPSYLGFSYLAPGVYVHWNHNLRKLANLITWTTALFNSMKLSHAMWGPPRWMGHGGEVWLNVVHWRREWQTTSVFLPWEPHEQYEKANDRILKEEPSRSVGAQYATGDQWRNNSRKNEGMEPKQKQYPAVDVTDDRSKVRCCKEQYCIGTWNVSPWIKANWKWSNGRW